MRSAALGWPTLRELAAEGALAAHSKTYGGWSRNRRDTAYRGRCLGGGASDTELIAGRIYLPLVSRLAAPSGGKFARGKSMEQCGRLEVG